MIDGHHSGMQCWAVSPWMRTTVDGHMTCRL
jgi:hypothetical protein